MTEKLSKLTPEDGKSLDVESQNIEQLKQLFPDVFREGKVDFEALKAVLGEHIEDKEERYNFTWHGKNKARQIAQTPTTATLRPCKEQSVNWGNTQNLFIEGDNLEVLKLLQKSYHKKVKLIYIDPPYNTGKDFIYKDDFKDNVKNYLESTGQVTDSGVKHSANPNTSGRYHTNWLNMMYPRLKLAKNLLSEDGVILVSIGDAEFSHLSAIMNEIFGEENLVGTFTWKSRAKPTNAGNSKFRPQKVGEYILAYGRKAVDEQVFNVVSSKSRAYPHEDADGKYRTTTILTSNRGTFRRETMRFEAGGYTPDADYRWKAGKKVIEGLLATNRILFNDEGIPLEKKYEAEEQDPLYPIYTFMAPELTGTAENGKSDLNELVGNKHGLDTVKPVQLIKYLISTFTNDKDIVFDFFAGSCTTAQAVIELNKEQLSNRRFFLTQLPEVIPSDSEAYLGGFRTINDIGKARLQRLGERLNDNNIDTGFKYLKLDQSNIRLWESDFDELPDILKDSVDSIKPERDSQDVLYEILLKYGLDLTYPIFEHILTGKTVYDVALGALLVCLDDEISKETVEAIGKLKQSLDCETTRVVFKDAGFADDAVKVNAMQLLKQYGVDDVKSI